MIDLNKLTCDLYIKPFIDDNKKSSIKYKLYTSCLLIGLIH